MLVVCMAIPVSSFAFRNPNQNPQNIIRVQEKPGIQKASPAVDTPTTEIQTGTKDNDSSNQAASVLKAGEISAANPAAIALRKASGFDAFNNLNQNSWQATFSTKTGRVKQLSGARSKAYGDTPENNAREFLKDTHMLFGVASDLSNLKTSNINQTAERQHIRFQQTVDGVSVQGAQIIVHSDQKGRITMVQNDCRDKIAPANQNLLSLEMAQNIAREGLSVQLGPKATLTESIIENLIIPHKGGYAYIWKITTPTQNPTGAWVLHVDAQNGEILYRGDENFYLTKGKGQAYLDNEAWHDNYKLKKVKLEDLYETDDGFVEGYLHGPHATIHDWPRACTVEEADNGSYDEKCKRLDAYNLADSNKLNFVYDPFAAEDWEDGSEKPYFDQAQAYYQKNMVWEWWEKNVIKKYGPTDIDYFYWLSIPTAVNRGEWDKDGFSTFCNAYYTRFFPLNPYNGDYPGFVYADDESCFDEDLVIDLSIVRHEYAHAIMDWAGFMDDGQFGGEVNGYGRSMGEGNSDWYAFLPSGQSSIGYVAWPPWGDRNIDNGNRYPDDVNDPDWYYEYEDAEPPCPGYAGQPEEHYTGEIWGGYLYELSRVLGKKALGFVYQSSFYFRRADGHRDGYPDFVDAIRAQQVAEKQLTGSNKLFFKAFGTMVSRGFIKPLAPLYSNPCDYFGTGAPGSDERDYLYLEAPLKLKTEANLLISGDLNEYPVEAKAGMVLTAQVKSKKNGLRGPIIELFTIDGTRLAVTDYSNNTKARIQVRSATANGVLV